MRNDNAVSCAGWCSGDAGPIEEEHRKLGGQGVQVASGMAWGSGEEQKAELRVRAREREAAGSGAVTDHWSESAEQQQVVESSHDGERSEQTRG